MTVRYETLKEGGCLYVQGELDHHAAADAIRSACTLLDTYQPGNLLLDLSGLTFMDSSGLAFLMRLKKRMQYVGGTLRVIHVPNQAYRVLVSAGMHQLIQITQKEN